MMTTGRRALLGLVSASVVLGAGLMAAGMRNDGDRAKGSPSAAPAVATVPAMQIGMNLGPPAYWTSEWPFADLVQSTGTLVATNMPNWFQLDAPGSPLPLDSTGRPGPVPARAMLGAVLQIGSPRLPIGAYDCRVSPDWRVSATDAWTLIGSADAPGGRFGMRIENPEPKAPLTIYLHPKRDGVRLDRLSCRMQGIAEAETFNPRFLAEARPFRVLRFMDWMFTNVAGHRRWKDRTTPTSFSQVQPGGVAIEHMVALANLLDADPWFTLPIDADPDYYRSFAEYVRDNLRPDRRAYVELSNEVWNTAFPQSKFAKAEGQKRYPAAQPDEATDYYYADRVREVMDQWTQVFGPRRDRIVRVLGSQAVYKARIERTIGHGDVARHVDALTTAAYFGTDGSRQPTLTGKAKVDAIYADGPRLVDETIGYAKIGKEIAARYGLRFIAYEGGPGFTAPATVYRTDIQAVEQDPRMEALYRSFLQRWKNEIGDLLVVFTNVATDSHGNLFGHRKYTGQPLSEAPKARAVLDPAWGARVDPPAR